MGKMYGSESTYPHASLFAVTGGKIAERIKREKGRQGEREGEKLEREREIITPRNQISSLLQSSLELDRTFPMLCRHFGKIQVARIFQNSRERNFK